MKAKLSLLLLSFVGIAASIPDKQAFYGTGSSRRVVLQGQAFDVPSDPQPGFNLDLDELRLVQLSEGQEPVWMTELEKIEAKAKGLRFFDVTENSGLGSSAHLRLATKTLYPPLSAHEQVTKVIKTLSTEGPKANLQKFSSYRTRYYRSETGRDSQLWLLSKINEITTEVASPSLKSMISVNEFHHSWGQHSIIVRINGSDPVDDRVVILGAHQDSMNMWPFLPAPGADDDGSGSVTILESYRALLASDFHPVRPVEFHWYSAEEGGLLGSQAVAQHYEARGLKVYAMSQYDMTAWVKRGMPEEVGVIVDFVDPTLTAFNKALIDEYLDIPFVETKCGYACSDHASWSKAGYPSIFTIEAAFENANNNNIHSANDRINISDEFSFLHMLEFSKLAVAFAIELGSSN
ncbi:Zn-dependent exopeptidase [Rhizopogon salebrosus TDB-379]|nr:Zn-dependent exopeptidase [Rhizopogon salebrosus TDB-379]